MASFEPAVHYVLDNEGGFVDDPEDDGHATNMGITLETLSKHRGIPVSVEDVKNLTRQEAATIYLDFFWNPMGLSSVESQGIATAVLDIAVNLGQFRAVTWLQKYVGATPDGHLGPQTLELISHFPVFDVIRGLMTAQVGHYVDIVVDRPAKIKFLKGWIYRSMKMVTLVI